MTRCLAVGAVLLLLGCGRDTSRTPSEPEVTAADVPRLVQQLQQPEASARLLAANSLGRVGAEAAAAVPALQKALKDREATVREEAAAALGKIGPAAQEATPTLRALAANDRDYDVRSAASSALKVIDAGAP